jgi:hypothetical protein
MVCNVLEECRCYAFRGDNKQFCGVRRGPEVLVCPTECCHGGCTDDGSRQPFRYIDRPNMTVKLGNVNALIIISIIVLMYLLVININLKSRGVR